MYLNTRRESWLTAQQSHITSHYSKLMLHVYFQLQSKDEKLVELELYVNILMKFTDMILTFIKLKLK